MALHTTRFIAKTHEFYSGGHHNTGHIYGHIIVTRRTFDCAAKRSGCINNTRFAAIGANEVLVSWCAVTFGTRFLYLAIFIPMDEGFCLGIIVRRIGPFFLKGNDGYGHFNLRRDLNHSRDFDLDGFPRDLNLDGFPRDLNFNYAGYFYRFALTCGKNKQDKK
jgi:hypothetical protein